MNLPTVSIIVPVYNVGLCIEACIQSVMRQTYAGLIECIVVNDGCSDDSMKIVERLVSDYDGSVGFVILHHNHNRGLSAARNTGIDAASGDYVFFLDGDDVLTDDCIEKLMTVAEADPSIEIIQGNVKRIPEETPDPLTRHYSMICARTNTDVRYCTYQLNQLFYVWNKVYKRSFLNENNLRFSEGLLWEDVLWRFYVVKYASSVSFVPGITYYYRDRPGSIVYTDEAIKHSHYKRIYTEILSNLSPGYESEEISYYIKDFPCKYGRFPYLYKDVYALFLKTAWLYKSLSCFKSLVFASFARLKIDLRRLFDNKNKL